jgi:hypothetical protein
MRHRALHERALKQAAANFQRAQEEHRITLIWA